MTADDPSHTRRAGMCISALSLTIALVLPVAAADPGDEEDDISPQGCAVTPGGWGAPPRGNNPASLLYAHFDDVFGDALVVGDIEFDEASEITDAIPSGDALLNHVVALAINLAFSEAALLSGRLADVTVPDGEFEGLTAWELLAIGEEALQDDDRSPGEYSALIDALTGFNEQAFGCEAVAPECPDGEMSGDDGDCVPVCPDGEMPDESGDCVPVCPDGEMPDESGDCVPVCPDGEMPDESGDCVPICPDGEMPDESGDCVPICPDGEMPDESGDCAAADIPSCPPNVTATAGDEGVIALGWTAVAGADAYRVYRHGPEGGWLRVATLNATAYVDNDTEVGATYSYRVTAVADGVESTGCPVVTATAIPFFPALVVGALALVGAVGAYAWLRRR